MNIEQGLFCIYMYMIYVYKKSWLWDVVIEKHCV